jgi:hypothetical protein
MGPRPPCRHTRCLSVVTIKLPPRLRSEKPPSPRCLQTPQGPCRRRVGFGVGNWWTRRSTILCTSARRPADPQTPRIQPSFGQEQAPPPTPDQLPAVRLSTVAQRARGRSEQSLKPYFKVFPLDALGTRADARWFSSGVLLLLFPFLLISFQRQQNEERTGHDSMFKNLPRRGMRLACRSGTLTDSSRVANAGRTPPGAAWAGWSDRRSGIPLRNLESRDSRHEHS